MTYEDWKKKSKVLINSPDIHYTEQAWDGAIMAALSILNSGAQFHVIKSEITNLLISEGLKK